MKTIKRNHPRLIITIITLVFLLVGPVWAISGNKKIVKSDAKENQATVKFEADNANILYVGRMLSAEACSTTKPISTA